MNWKRNFPRCWTDFVAAALLIAGGPTAARADGEFLQFDYAPGQSSATASMQRGRMTVALGWSEYDTGHATSLWLNRGYQLDGPVWFRVGPSLRVDESGDARWGLRGALERFTMSETQTLFLLVDVNTIQREFQVLGQIGHIPSGWAGEMAFQGNDSGYREVSVAVSYRLGDGPFRLRAGYRIEAAQPFIGLSLNTF